MKIDKTFIVASVVSALMLVVAGLILLKLKTLVAMVRFPLDVTYFHIDCAFYAAMIHLTIFGLSTWLYTSNFHDTRYQNRIFMLMVLLIHAINLIRYYLSGAYKENYSGADDKIMKFDTDIWEPNHLSAFGLGLGVILLLVCAVILIAVVVFNTIKPPSVPDPRGDKRVKSKEKPKRRAKREFK